MVLSRQIVTPDCSIRDTPSRQRHPQFYEQIVRVLYAKKKIKFHIKIKISLHSLIMPLISEGLELKEEQ